MKINNIFYIVTTIGILLFFTLLIIRYLLFNINKPIVETLNIGGDSYDFSINAEGIPVDKDGNPVYDYHKLDSLGTVFSKSISKYVNIDQLPVFISGVDDSANNMQRKNNSNYLDTLLGGGSGSESEYISKFPFLSSNYKTPTLPPVDKNYVDKNVVISPPSPFSNPIELRQGATKRTKPVFGNNGSVSCQAYCAGSGNGRPWNNELPQDWNGAQCTSVSGKVKNFKITMDYPTANYSIDCDSSWNPSIVDVSCICEETGYGWKTGGTGYFFNNGSVSCNDFCSKGGGETGELVPYSWYGAKCTGVVNIGSGGDLGGCDGKWSNSWNGQVPAPNGTNFGKCQCQSTGLGWKDYSHTDKPNLPPNLPDNSQIKCTSDKICAGFEPDGKVYCYGDNRGCKWNQNDCNTDADCKAKYYPGLSPKYTDGKQLSCQNYDNFWNNFMTFNFDHWLNDNQLMSGSNWGYKVCPSKYAITKSGPNTQLARAGRNANNGTVSCNDFCKGINGGPWTSNIPSSWNGAKCVAVESNFRDKGLNCDNGFTVGANDRGSKDGKPTWADCICTNTGSGWRPSVPPKGTIFCGRNNACVGVGNDGYSYLFGHKPWSDNNDGRCNSNADCAKFNWNSYKYTDRKRCSDADNDMSWWADPCHLPKDWEIKGWGGRYGEAR
uniref:Uncharacterized protein n=1 Tax=viral metagenome TaxID=1070528 RepID=A0A6C0DRR7_9ZZZZ